MYIGWVRVIARKALKVFWGKYEDSEQSLKAWFHEAKKAKWANPNEIKAQYRSASILNGGRVVFNICGNRYRLLVKVNFKSKIIFIRFIGTHKEYDKIDAGAL